MAFQLEHLTPHHVRYQSEAMVTLLPKLQVRHYALRLIDRKHSYREHSTTQHSRSQLALSINGPESVFSGCLSARERWEAGCRGAAVVWGKVSSLFPV